MADRRKLAQGLMMMTPAMREDLAGREQDIQRGKTVELLRRAGKEMYENPIVNTAIGFTPGVGDVQAAGETVAALQRGAPWQETAGYAVGMLPFVPALRTTWHGSPHGFTKFDMSKIGTGEGAQAYGHGLYLAEARPVAEEYKQALSNPEVVLKSGERITNPAIGSHEDVAKAWLEEQFLKGSKTPFDDAISRLNKLKSAANNPQQFEGAVDVLNKWKNEGASVDLGGYLYKVDLPDEQIAKMLDWDKPLSEQPQAVQDALHQAALVNFETNIGPKASGEIGDLGWTKNVKSMSGEDLYRKLTEGAFTNEMFLQGTKKGEAQAVVSDKLRQAGIPGIQYLDQASRGAGEGTRNYVVFSDEIPQILERNGQPIARALRDYEAPQAQALREAEEYGQKMLGLPLGNTPMDRAIAMGYDTNLYHATGSDINEFKPSEYRQASFFAASPQQAIKGRNAGLGDRTATGTQENIMPLLAKSEDIVGLGFSPKEKSILKNYAGIVTENEVNKAMGEIGKGSWTNYFDEIQNPDGTFAYKVKNPISYEQAINSGVDVYGRQHGNYATASDERWAANNAKNQAMKGFMQYDEGGLSVGLADPSNIRSRFAAFDPRYAGKPGLLLGAGGLGVYGALQDEDEYQ